MEREGAPGRRHRASLLHNSVTEGAGLKYPGAWYGWHAWESRRQQQAAEPGDADRSRRMRPKGDHRINLASRKQFQLMMKREPERRGNLVDASRGSGGGFFLKRTSNSGTAVTGCPSIIRIGETVELRLTGAAFEVTNHKEEAFLQACRKQIASLCLSWLGEAQPSGVSI